MFGGTKEEQFTVTSTHIRERKRERERRRSVPLERLGRLFLLKEPFKLCTRIYFGVSVKLLKETMKSFDVYFVEGKILNTLRSDNKLS